MFNYFLSLSFPVSSNVDSRLNYRSMRFQTTANHEPLENSSTSTKQERRRQREIQKQPECLQQTTDIGGNESERSKVLVDN